LTGTKAFGLPDGTIGALLALSLLVVFVGLATFLFGNLSSPQGASGLQPVGKPFSVQAAQLDAVLQRIPEQLVVLPSLSEDGERYSVQVFAAYEGSSATSEDLAGQIFTAVSTILVTVIGFYFGSRTTAAGAGGATQVTPAERASAAAAAAQKSATDAAAAAESATAAAASAGEAASKPDASNAVREQAEAVQRAAVKAKAAGAAADEAASKAKRLAAEAAAATDDASRENAASSAVLAQATAQEAAKKALDQAQKAEDALKKLQAILAGQKSPGS
jgi:Putative metallopeptidase domain